MHMQGYQNGYRSSLAGSLLERQGRDGIVDPVGSYKAWLASK